MSDTTPPPVTDSVPVPEMAASTARGPVWRNSIEPLLRTGPVTRAPWSNTMTVSGAIVPPAYAAVTMINLGPGTSIPSTVMPFPESRIPHTRFVSGERMLIDRPHSEARIEHRTAASPTGEPAAMMAALPCRPSRFTPRSPMTEAVLVVDLQNDFCPGGALPVADGDAIVPLVNRLLAEKPVRVLTADWHPPDHASFASAHPGSQPFSRRLIDGVEHMLWPDHCVQGTPGASFHPALHADRATMILRKGTSPTDGSYSAFFEQAQAVPTGLDGYLRSRGVSDLAIVGLALDFCVAASAIDAALLGYRVHVIEAGCRAIDVDGSLAAARQAMAAVGVMLVPASQGA